MDAQEYIDYLNSLFSDKPDEKIDKAIKRFKARLGPAQLYTLYTLIEMSLRQITIDAVNLMHYSRSAAEKKIVIDEALTEIEKIVVKNLRLREYVQSCYGWGWVADAARRSSAKVDLIKIALREIIRDVVASTCDALMLALKCLDNEKTN